MVSLDAVRRYCSKKAGTVTEDFPFDDETLVIKIAGKAFLLADITRDIPAVNLKCDPDLALELRTRYDAVQPGYHMNKKHWNTVTMDGSIPDEEIFGMIDHSYERVVAGLPATDRLALAGKGHRSTTKKPARGGQSRRRKT